MAKSNLYQYGLIGVVSLTAIGNSRADVPIRATRITSGLTKPLYITQAPGDDSRLFIVEQTGSGTLATTGDIKVLNTSNNSVNSTPFISIPGLANGNEQGLLGLAFNPNYATNGLFYITCVTPGGAFGNGAVELREYQRNTADVANPTLVRTLLKVDHPQTNHNGGWINFGPTDGYLYMTIGDGGNSNDSGTGHTEPGGNAQDLTNNLLGKMLRLDVNNGDDFPTNANKNYHIPASNPFVGTGNDGEIYNYGLRNAWRPSFDKLTNDLYIADVGQDTREEVDFQSHTVVGGTNFGWRQMEGSQPRPGNTEAIPANAVGPIIDYTHNGGSRSITGGFVYRGTENDALAGTYFYADYVTNQISSFQYDGTTLTKSRNLTGLIPTNVGALTSITSFGQDNAGNLYIVSQNNGIYRLKPALPGDADLSLTVDINDLGVLASHWQTLSGATWATGDFTDDGIVDINDLGVLASHWQLSTTGLIAALESLGLPTSSVPEPATIALAALGALALRRRARFSK